jgi:hypothetical protein
MEWKMEYISNLYLEIIEFSFITFVHIFLYFMRKNVVVLVTKH